MAVQALRIGADGGNSLPHNTLALRFRQRLVGDGQKFLLPRSALELRSRPFLEKLSFAQPWERVLNHFLNKKGF